MRPDVMRRRVELDHQLRQQRGLRRMAGGSIDGRAEVAAPLPARPKATPYLPSAAGGGRHRGFILVVDSELPADIVDGADYVCDSDADDVEIQLAIDDASDRMCDVLALGYFNIDADIDMYEKGIMLRGAGVASTWIGGSYDIVLAGWNTGLSSFNLDGGNVRIDFGATLVVEHLYVGGWIGQYDGDMALYNSRIRDNEVDGVTADGYSIDLVGNVPTGNVDVWVERNRTNWGVRLTGGGGGIKNRLHLVENHAEETSKVEDARVVSIVGHMQQDATDLEVTDIDKLAIVGTVLDSGSYVETSCTNVDKAGNVGTGF